MMLPNTHQDMACGVQVMIEPIQAAVAAVPAPGSNHLPRAMQLVTNVAVLMHALPHLDDFILLAARYDMPCSVS